VAPAQAVMKINMEFFYVSGGGGPAGGGAKTVDVAEGVIGVKIRPEPETSPKTEVPEP